MNNLNDIRAKGELQMDLIKKIYLEHNSPKREQELEQYLLNILDARNKKNIEGKVAALYLENTLVKYLVAYNAYHNVELENDVNSVEFALKYRSLNNKEIGILLYNYINQTNGIHQTSTLLRNEPQLRIALVNLYIKNDILNEKTNQLYNPKNMSLDTKSLMEQVDFYYESNAYAIAENSKNNNFIEQLELQLPEKQLHFQF